MFDISTQQKGINLFHRQQEKQRVSHAYLLVGGNGSYEMAIYMAQSLVCHQQAVGACQECNNCIKVSSNQYSDLKIIDGSEKSIKKDDILKLKESFIQTSLEADGHKIYIIDSVDNATPDGLNSLLKFLEEPEGNVTAILTTNNENRVLETIKSRCLIVSLQAPSFENKTQNLMTKGYEEREAYILGMIYEEESRIEELLNDERHQQIRDLAIDFITAVDQRRVAEAIIILQIDGLKTLKLDRNEVKQLLEIIAVCLSSNGQHFASIRMLTQSMTLERRQKLMKVVIDIIDRIRPGVNINLLMDQCAFNLTNELSDL